MDSYIILRMEFIGINLELEEAILILNLRKEQFLQFLIALLLMQMIIFLKMKLEDFNSNFIK